MAKWYGSVQNRIEEGKNYTNRELKAGDDITMYLWSDRRCYYITRVVDQKHIFVKPYEVVADREKEGGMGHQNWLYFKTIKECNDYLNKYGLGTKGEVYENAEQEWVFRYGHWYIKSDYWYDVKLEKPKYTRLQPISFGVRDYYHDWEF